MRLGPMRDAPSSADGKGGTGMTRTSVRVGILPALSMVAVVTLVLTGCVASQLHRQVTEEAEDSVEAEMGFVLKQARDTFAGLEPGRTLSPPQVVAVFGNDLTESDLDEGDTPRLRDTNAAVYSAETSDGYTTYGVFFGGHGSASFGQGSDSAAAHGCGLLALKAGTRTVLLSDEACPSALQSWASVDSFEVSLSEVAKNLDVYVETD